MHTHYGTPTKNITHLTRCLIEDLSYQKGSLARGVTTGTAECSKKDKFVKDTGRKLSLSRALKFTTWGKDYRAAFWREYMGRKGNPANIPTEGMLKSRQALAGASLLQGEKT
jgi:hypothetical protein